VAIVLAPVDSLTQAETGDINASSLNKPLQQLSNNQQLLQQELAAISSNRIIATNNRCVAAVAVGMPVCWWAPTNSFEPAIAGVRPAVGLCIAKHGDVLCDVQMGGYITSIDLTASTGEAIPAAGIYYVSQTTAGLLLSIRPTAGIQHPLLFADGQGGAFLYNAGEYLPLQGLQGIQGIPGTTGAVGATGATGATGPAALPAMASGRWYLGPISFSPMGANANLPGNQLLAVPFAAPGGVTLSELGIKILAAGNPGDEGKLGIYANAGNYPGSLLTAANGVFNGGSAGPKSISITDTVLAAGQLVWLVVLANSSSMGLYSIPKEGAWAYMGWDNGFLDPVLGYAIDYTYSSLPATFPSSANELTAIIPAIFAKVK
jgi:hypothetical protein